MKKKLPDDENKKDVVSDTVPEDQETFPNNRPLQAELDSLDNADRIRRNAIYKLRLGK